MKFIYMTVMPYRDLPQDFKEKHDSIWVTLPNDVYDTDKGPELYNDYIDLYEQAIEQGFDAVGVNEHHGNAYGLNPSPNLIAATLARKVRKTEKGCLVILGDSLALYNPPVRVAEELAVLDNITGGRVIAGFPVGTSMDTNFMYGITPAELRPRFFEAHDLIVKAWQTKEPFAFNGEYTQLRYVNVWPRTVQEPHPPVWIPGGGGSVETWDFCAKNDYQYCYLSFYGHRFAQAMFDGFWERREKHGLDMNPYRAGFTQLVCVSDTDAKAKEEYEQYVNNFWDLYLHVSPKFREAPGYRTAASIERGMKTQYGSEAKGAKLRIGLEWDELIEQGFVIAGSPSSVRDQLRHAIKKLHIGNLIPQLAFANMPQWLASKNIELFAREVMPELRDIWDDQYPVTNWPEVQHNELNKQAATQV